MRERRGERHELLLAHPEPAGRCARVQFVHADGGQCLDRLRPERRRGYESEPARKVGEEQVLGNAQRRHQVQLLHDQLHPGALRVAPAVGVVAFTAEAHGAAIRCGQAANDP